MVRRRWSILRGIAGPTTPGAGCRSRGRSSTRCTWGPSPPEARGDPRGSARSASRRVHVIEMMPVAEFSGDFGWGYDGVDFFAPARRTGRRTTSGPSSIARTVSGFGVILDVVYNHVGPDGNYLASSPTAISAIGTRPTGARPSTTTVRAAAGSGSSSSRTPPTGSTNTTSTACGSTRRTPSTTNPRPTCWRR